MAYTNPYEGKSLDEIYDGLQSGAFGPRWPDENLQKGYAGTNKTQLLGRAFDFIDMLKKDGAFDGDDWKGLDYGCGWGRFASVMLREGPASQFDLCDAWQVTLDHIAKLDYDNHIFKVPSLLTDGAIPEDTYDFILSFSVFTHISHQSFQENLPRLIKALKDDGKLYITVRHDEFIDHKYPDRKDEIMGVLNDQGYAFLDSGGDMNNEKLFGDMIVTKGYLDQFGTNEYLGKPHSLQHVYRFTK